MKNVLVVTLGCKTNQYESEALLRRLAALGCRAVESGVCEFAVVNTCTVTVRADRRCRQHVSRIAREHPGLPIYVTGCYALRRREELSALPGVAEVCADKDELFDTIARREHLAAADETAGLGFLRPGENVTGRRARTYLKIQDGCDQFCSYCIVPYVRPTLRSEPIDDVVREARCMVAAGFREIVLTGIHLGRYGADRSDGVTLTDVIRQVAAVPGLDRVRLSSIENPEVADDLLDLIASTPVVCPHLHLPLQSGDNGVLAAMNRRYSAASFLETVRRIRERIPDPAITTDIIVGFPGESDDAFENTLDVCRRAQFSKVHVFPFSARPGTQAADLAKRLPARVITRRKKRMVALGDELALEFKTRFLGKTVRVLFESSEPAADGTILASGLTERYLRVNVTSDAEIVNTIAPVVVERVTPQWMEGRLGD